MDFASFLIWNGLSLGAAVLIGVFFLNRKRLTRKGTGGEESIEDDNTEVFNVTV